MVLQVNTTLCGNEPQYIYTIYIHTHGVSQPPDVPAQKSDSKSAIRVGKRPRVKRGPRPELRRLVPTRVGTIAPPFIWRS